MTAALERLGGYVAAAVPEAVIRHSVVKGELVLDVRREAIESVCRFLRDDPECLFKLFVDLCGVDWPQRTPERFDVVYNLLSLKHNRRIRLKLTASETTPVPSVTGVWSAAGWWERETWDLFGVMFDGNPDLRRILTDYGFEGHPFRKDFPLTGYVEVRYDEEQKRVVYEPVKLKQEFRSFDFLSPWEGMDRVLPGDEKAS
ncbi:MAG: NADH-quinone oxidoreductase subunit C [Rhodospirillales bacterium]|nr:NADH-quinone oxidoreductase subunit C [Rhodospirillales bacterium]